MVKGVDIMNKVKKAKELKEQGYLAVAIFEKEDLKSILKDYCELNEKNISKSDLADLESIIEAYYIDEIEESMYEAGYQMIMDIIGRNDYDY